MPFAYPGDIVIPVIADQDTVGDTVRDSLEAVRRGWIIDLFPAGEMLKKKCVVIQIAFVDGYDDMLLFGKQRQI